ncbi:MAG: HAD hydrolase-like protein, partial [Verrucomicrobiota bacterium]
VEEGLDDEVEIGDCFIIGDTPSDIAAARANRMTAVAVATGTYDRNALEDAGAHHVLDDLSDLDQVLGLLNLAAT